MEGGAGVKKAIAWIILSGMFAFFIFGVIYEFATKGLSFALTLSVGLAACCVMAWAFNAVGK